MDCGGLSNVCKDIPDTCFKRRKQETWQKWGNNIGVKQTVTERVTEDKMDQEPYYRKTSGDEEQTKTGTESSKKNDID